MKTLNIFFFFIFSFLFFSQNIEAQKCFDNWGRKTKIPLYMRSKFKLPKSLSPKVELLSISANWQEHVKKSTNPPPSFSFLKEEDEYEEIKRSRTVQSFMAGFDFYSFDFLVGARMEDKKIHPAISAGFGMDFFNLLFKEDLSFNLNKDISVSPNLNLKANFLYAFREGFYFQPKLALGGNVSFSKGKKEHTVSLFGFCQLEKVKYLDLEHGVRVDGEYREFFGFGVIYYPPISKNNSKKTQDNDFLSLFE